jgi:dTDP-4-amino-4,6-dideoxygalactose transaminase
MELWRIRRALEHQFDNLRKLSRGQLLSYVPLSGLTLDRDDVDLAYQGLASPESWQSPELAVRYERAFADWNGSSHAFSFMAGRVALSACLDALGLLPGDEVIVPGYTCVVVPNAIKYAGLSPVYADIELDTYGLDVSDVERRISPRTRAILLHHLYGLVCRDYDDLISLARQRGLFVIEDCAHATGARYRGIPVGNRGDVAFYSSEQSKVFNTIQGGMAITNRDDLASRLAAYQQAAPLPSGERIRAQLQNLILDYYVTKDPQRWWRGDIAELRFGHSRLTSTTADEIKGVRPHYYGCRMAAPIAQIGLNQIRKLDRYNQERRATAEHWEQWALKQGYKLPRVVADSLPVFLRYPLMVEEAKKRDRAWAREELGVELGVWFVSHIHPAPGSLPGVPAADQAVARCVNLPTLGVL